MRFRSSRQRKAVMAKLSKREIVASHKLGKRLFKYKDRIKEPYAIAAYITKKKRRS